jgi:hypothetical protein
MSDQNIKEITYIYLVTHIDGDPNKVYIGKTKNFSRERDHRCKFGNQIQFTIIDQIATLSRVSWQPLETYWINQFIAWGFTVVNTKKVGGSGVEYHTNSTKAKIREAHLKSQVRGEGHHNYGKPNPALSALNKQKVGVNHPMFGKKNLGASKSSSARVGAKNPNFGKVWITDGENNSMVFKNSLLPTGWYSGRTKNIRNVK